VVDHFPDRVIDLAELVLPHSKRAEIRDRKEQQAIIVRVMNNLSENGLVAEKIDQEAMDKGYL